MDARVQGEYNEIEEAKDMVARKIECELEKDPATVFTDIHFEKKSIAHEAYHLSHGLCQ